MITFKDVADDMMMSGRLKYEFREATGKDRYVHALIERCVPDNEERRFRWSKNISTNGVEGHVLNSVEADLDEAFRLSDMLFADEGWSKGIGREYSNFPGSAIAAYVASNMDRFEGLAAEVMRLRDRYASLEFLRNVSRNLEQCGNTYPKRICMSPLIDSSIEGMLSSALSHDDGLSLVVKHRTVFNEGLDKKDDYLDAISRYFVSLEAGINALFYELLSKAIDMDFRDGNSIAGTDEMVSNRYPSLMFHALMNGKPHRKDWQTMDVNELASDCEASLNAVRKLVTSAKKYGLMSVRNDMVQHGRLDNGSINYDMPVELFLVKFWPNIQAIARNGSGGEALEMEYDAPKNVFLSEDDDIDRLIYVMRNRRQVEFRRHRIGERFAGKTNFPDNAFGFTVSKLSNGIIPAFIAKDFSGINMVLVPASRKAWCAMLDMYGIGQRDALVNDNKVSQMLLNPEGHAFTSCFSEKFALSHIGSVNIRDFLDGETALRETYDAAVPENVFHAFLTSRV